MTFFDIYTAVSRAFHSTFAARSYLLRLMVVPFVLKLICFTLAVSYGGTDSAQGYLRFMLIMVPAFLAEGWMLSHFVRYLVLGQTWPFQGSGNFDADMAILEVRARGVLGGTIVYTLIHMALAVIMAALMALVWPYIPEDPQSEVMQLPTPLALAVLASVPFLLWGFRLVWLYIPFALNGGDIKHYVETLRGFKSSFALMGVWLLCVTPFVFFLRIVAGVVGAGAGSFGEGFASFLIIVVSVAVDLVKGLVVAAGIAFALQHFYFKKVKP